jgi:hypothetical protein
MKKVILNKCFGGYEWSRAAALDYVERSGMNHIMFMKWVKGGKSIAATKEQYLANEYGVEMYICKSRFYEGSISRTDPIAIQLFEEKGSEYCSGPNSKLEIEEYDDEFFGYDIYDYDGIEDLELTPMLTEDRIRKCGSIDKIVELLYSCNVLRKDGSGK